MRLLIRLKTCGHHNLDQDCIILKVPARSCCIGSKTLTHIGLRGMKIRIFGGFARLKRRLSAIFKKL